MVADMRIFYFAFLIITFLALPGFAQLSGNPENWCREGFFSRESESFSVGMVKPRRSNFFSDDGKNCPSSSCRTSSYVVRGDTVITNKSFGRYTCAWFTSSQGGTRIGWLKTADLDFPEPAQSDKTAWLGEWRYATSTIKILSSDSGRTFSVRGDSYWKGLGSNIHIGELNNEAVLADGILRYSDGESEYDCSVTMRLKLDKYMIVADNGNCGGANVSFSGIYRKINSKPSKR